MLRTKVYPNGEVTFSWQKTFKMPKLEGEWERSEEQRITSADITNHGIQAAIDFRFSEQSPDGSATPGLVKSSLFTQPPRRLRRGGKGITRYGRRLIECGAALMEDRYGTERCSFLTLTLPPSAAPWTIESVNKAYNRFQTELLRELDRCGLPQLIVGCIEAHPERSEREGRMVPHYHLVFVGRERYKHWAIDTEWFRDRWCDCLENSGSIAPGTDRRAATSVEGVKKSVAAYMGKYLSKASDWKRDSEKNDEEKDSPGSWHKISRKMLTLIKSSIIVRRGAQAERLLELLRHDQTGSVLFITSVTLDRDGDSWWIGEYVRLKRKSIGYFLRLSGARSRQE